MTSAVALALSLPALGANDIFRCSAKGGAVSYQQMPCDESTVGDRANVPTEFPPVNTAERERLLAKEEALYRRLEARRDREIQEMALRDAAAERALERERLAAQQQQDTLVAYPAYLVGYPLRPRIQPRSPVKRTGYY
ncbi:MAG TPA: hypothetical protein VLT60_05940 [Usitatibacter sp.]|nr:hypothetical protein [Usitatibacter sp.]